MLQLILMSDEKESIVLELSDALCLLLSMLVKKLTHLHQSEMHLDTLVPVLASLLFAICSAKSSLFILHKVSLLHSPDVIDRVGEIVLSCIRLSSTSEYLEVLLHWEWWYFLPRPLADSLKTKLYILAQSLSPDKPDLAASLAHIETLCKEAQTLPIELKGLLEEYAHTIPTYITAPF